MKPDHETLEDRLEDALLACGVTPTKKLCSLLLWAIGANTITPQQFAVLRLAIGGLADKQIADELGIHSRTLELHWHELRQRLGINSRCQIGAAVVISLRIPAG